MTDLRDDDHPPAAPHGARPPARRPACPASSPAWSAAATWSGRRASASADLADPDTPPDADDQFLVASNTKTFTAVLVMAAARRGPAQPRRHPRHARARGDAPGLTIRQCLAHVSGHAARAGRRRLGDAGQPRRAHELVSGFNEAERVHRPHDLLALLQPGLLDARPARRAARRPPWEESLKARMLDPLEMRRTTVGFDGRPRATGYYVPPFRDVPRAASRCSTSGRWTPAAAWPAPPPTWRGGRRSWPTPSPRCSRPDTLEEMCQPQVLIDPERWTAAMGLGFFLVRSGDRARTSATPAACPATSPAVFTHRESGTGGIALMNSTGARPGRRRLRDRRSPTTSSSTTRSRRSRGARDRRARRARRPRSAVWFTEGSPFTFSVRAGSARGAHRRAARPSRRLGVRAGRAGPLPHRLGAGRRGSCCGSPADADGRVRQDELGDVPRHPRAARVRRVAGLTRRTGAEPHGRLTW